MTWKYMNSLVKLVKLANRANEPPTRLVIAYMVQDKSRPPVALRANQTSEIKSKFEQFSQ
jgi:predicted GTPase